MKQVITINERDIRRMVAEALLEVENKDSNGALEDAATDAIAAKTGASGGLVKKGAKFVKQNHNNVNFKNTRKNYKQRRDNGESRLKAYANTTKDNMKQNLQDAGEFYQELTPMEKAELAAILMESVNAMNL